MATPIEKFYVGSDFRVEESDVTELGVSIRSVGLLQSILVRETDDGYEVLAGRRRLRAMRDFLNWMELEEGKHFIVNPTVDALVAQLEENDHRENFTPQEKAALIHSIHSEGIERYGLAVKGSVTDGWSIDKTAVKIGRDKSYVSRMLLIYDNLHLVRDCYGFNDCLNKIKREKENYALNEIRHTKAKKAKYTGNIAEYFNNITVASAEDFLPTLQDDLVDFIFTDPPFAIDYANKYLDTDYYDIPYEDDPESILNVIKTIIPHLYRVLKLNKYMVMWCDFNLFTKLRGFMEDAGFRTSAIPVEWIKIGTAGKTKQPHLKLGSATQYAILAWKGDPELTIKGRANYFPYEIVRKNRIHQAQMPEALVEDFMNTFSHEGDLVLDCFAGSLVSLRAAFKTKRKWIGCEKQFGNVEDGKTYTKEWIGD